MALNHTHELDGELHVNCAACADILARYPEAMRQKRADQMADRYAKIATPKKRGK